MKILAILLALGAPLLAQKTTSKQPADPDANAPAASPAQNRPQKQLPPKGVAIPEKDRDELAAGVAALGREIAALKLAKLPRGTADPLPDVEIFHKAVDWALRHDEFHDMKQVGTARLLLAEGMSRAKALRDGNAPWITATGTVVRGYRSKIDGSVQPYGMEIPPSWKGPVDQQARPLWIWNHGRGDTLSELAFIADRMKKPGQFPSVDNFVLHPYGRYCNATKFAGEIDVFEALNAARREYLTDNDRIVNAGFSMGGASAWHLGVHHAGLWVASHTGAGFAETAEYAGVFATGKVPPPWWEQILWRWYDATVCAANLANSPMFAYHGSEDKQGQAIGIMKRFADKEGVKFEHFIGPGVGHKYELKTKEEIISRVSMAVARGRQPANEVRFVTYTLRYPEMKWVRVEGMERHWERAEVTAKVDGQSIVATTKNVTALRFTTPFAGNAPASDLIAKFTIDGQTLPAVWNKTGARYVKTKGRWSAGLLPDGLRKEPGLTGPIDDAFMASFVFVKPTGAPLNTAIGSWTQRELAHASRQWRGIFRGDAPTVDDSALSDAQIQASNLVLWGDPSSNGVLKRIADKLPVKWSKDGLEFGGTRYDAATHMPVLIFPNPLNPRRYVVLNSGFTFNRAVASGTNSQQTPKLPDWAIVDTTVPPDDRFPGKVVDAGFFDEQWRFTTEKPR
jgi:predicted esterase